MSCYCIDSVSQLALAVLSRFSSVPRNLLHLNDADRLSPERVRAVLHHRGRPLCLARLTLWQRLVAEEKRFQQTFGRCLPDKAHLAVGIERYKPARP